MIRTGSHLSPGHRWTLVWFLVLCLHLGIRKESEYLRHHCSNTSFLLVGANTNLKWSSYLLGTNNSLSPQRLPRSRPTAGRLSWCRVFCIHAERSKEGVNNKHYSLAGPQPPEQKSDRCVLLCRPLTSPLCPGGVGLLLKAMFKSNQRLESKLAIAVMTEALLPPTCTLVTRSVRKAPSSPDLVQVLLHVEWLCVVRKVTSTGVFLFVYLFKSFVRLKGRPACDESAIYEFLAWLVETAPWLPFGT